jgi:16S rRNA (adenine1518-N6/adenine1519-N6)-dimethyltransferase
MILTPDQIKHRLKSLGVRPDKYLGQHFLIDESVLATIQNRLEGFLQEGEKDIVVEVGPGLGVLTQVLANTAPHVVTIEKDPVFAQAIGGFIAKPNLTVIQGDVLGLLDTSPGFPLRFDINRFSSVPQKEAIFSTIDESICFDNPGADFDWLFVANIPYAITSPLLRKLVMLENPPRHILILVQKEMAERVTAQPGDSRRGRLTVELELIGQSEIIAIVPPQAFWPAPNVESALLHIDLRYPPTGLSAQERKELLRVVSAGFSSKRKKLANSLAGSLGKKASEVAELLTTLGINPDRRAETLTLEEWISLAKIIS